MRGCIWWGETENILSTSWPGLTRSSTSYCATKSKNVDARDKPGHDDLECDLLANLPVSRIGNHAAGDQPVPDEQHHQRADRGGDEAGALVGAVMTDRLTDEGGEKRTGDAEHGGQDEAARIVRPRRKQARDDCGDKANDDDPAD